MNISKKPNVFVVGDSHAECFKMATKQDDLLLNFVGAAAMPGKSAQGLNKQNNLDLCMNRLRLLQEDRIEYLGLLFGEIDCAYTILSRMGRNGTTEEEEMDFAINGIMKVARHLSTEKSKRTIILLPIIPLISDYSKPGIFTTLAQRMQDLAPYKERTNRLLLFNKKLEDQAIAQGYLVADINNRLLDLDTGVAKEEYQDNKAAWHHLGMKNALLFWTEEIVRIVIGEENGIT